VGFFICVVGYWFLIRRYCDLPAPSENSILGMQCKAQTKAIHQYCADLQRSNAPENWIYGSSAK
jgi:hypothetical protein